MTVKTFDPDFPAVEKDILAGDPDGTETDAIDQIICFISVYDQPGLQTI